LTLYSIRLRNWAVGDRNIRLIGNRIDGETGESNLGAFSDAAGLRVNLC
jgi:hypothetical protein